MKSGIYKIQNVISGKAYIGSAVYLSNRMATHRSDLKANKHRNLHMQNAYNKYGKDAFEYSILERVEDKANLVQCEQKHIDSHDFSMLYNKRKIAESNLGYKHSPESIARMSAAQKGRKVSTETRRKISEAQSGEKSWMYGRTGEDHPGYGMRRSDESRLKMSLAHMGKKPSPESIRKGVESRKGFRHSVESKEKMSDCQVGAKNLMYGVTGADHHQSKMVEFRGRSQNITEWAKELGITNSTLKTRLKRWPIERALTEPKNVEFSAERKKRISVARSKFLTFNGTTKSVSEWAEYLGITYSSLWERLRKWPLEKALTTPNLGRSKLASWDGVNV